MRIAIPCDAQDNVTSLLEDCRSLQMFEAENGQIGRRYALPLFSAETGAVLQLLEAARADAMICRELSRELKLALLEGNFLLFSGVIGPAERAVQAFLSGGLSGSSCACGEGAGCDGCCDHCGVHEGEETK